MLATEVLVLATEIDFVERLNGPHRAKAGEKVSLVCTPAEKCTISGTQLGKDGHYVEATVVMENVLIQSNKAVQSGALLALDLGSVTGTNLTFRNGTGGDWGGCVVSFGSFTCMDCVFDKCSASPRGGGVYSWLGSNRGGGLKLVRPTFTDNRCSDSKACGAGCYCKDTNASKCVGCDCKVDPAGPGFYCD